MPHRTEPRRKGKNNVSTYTMFFVEISLVFFNASIHSVQNYQEMSERTKRHEVQLIMMRFLSVLMSKAKSSTKLASEVSFIFDPQLLYFILKYIYIWNSSFVATWMGRWGWGNWDSFHTFCLIVL